MNPLWLKKWLAIIGLSVWVILALGRLCQTGQAIGQNFFLRRQTDEQKRLWLMGQPYALLQQARATIPVNARIFLTGTLNPEHYFWAVYYLYPRAVFIHEPSHKAIGDFHDPDEFKRDFDQNWLQAQHFSHILAFDSGLIQAIPAKSGE
jgi:hypothetical protein